MFRTYNGRPVLGIERDIARRGYMLRLGATTVEPEEATCFIDELDLEALPLLTLAEASPYRFLVEPPRSPKVHFPSRVAAMTEKLRPKERLLSVILVWGFGGWTEGSWNHLTGKTLWTR